MVAFQAPGVAPRLYSMVLLRDPLKRLVSLAHANGVPQVGVK